MGEVYRAQDLRLGREVALKLVRHSLVGDPASVQRVEEEARCASVLNHPNIVTIYGVGDHGDVSYIAMELVRGEALNSWSPEARWGPDLRWTSPSRSPTPLPLPTSMGLCTAI